MEGAIIHNAVGERQEVYESHCVPELQGDFSDPLTSESGARSGANYKDGYIAGNLLSMASLSTRVCPMTVETSSNRLDSIFAKLANLNQLSRTQCDVKFNRRYLKILGEEFPRNC